MRRVLFALLVLAAVLTGTVSLWIPLFIYRPAPLSDGRPQAWGLPGSREVAIVSGRERLSGWWTPAEAGSPVFLILHGRSGNISTRAAIAARLHADGFGVLLVDYRGYGRSTGHSDEASLVADATAAYEWLRAQGVEGGRVVALGQSLGDAPAARLAATRQVGVLVMVSPFTSLPEAVADRLGLPLAVLPPWPRNRFDVAASIARVRAPVLLVVSRTDGLVPYVNSRRVAVQAYDARWMEVEGRHDGLLSVATRTGRLSQAIRALTHPPGRPSP